MNTNRRYIRTNRQHLAAGFKKLLHTLIEPAPEIPDIALHHKSRLLAAFLLSMTAIFVLVDMYKSLAIPEYRIPWYGYLFLGTAYILNRSQYYTLAAALTLSMFPLVVFATPWSDAPSTVNTLNYLVLGILLASIFFSIRGLAIITVANITGLLLLPILAPNAIPAFTNIVTPLAVNTIGSALALVFMQHRDHLERDRQAELRASEERLRLALDAARMGIWDWDVLADIVTSSEQVAQLFGLPAAACPNTQTAYLQRVHPSDRAAVVDAITATLASAGSDYSITHRILCADGSLRWLEMQGRAYRDEIGRPARMTGTVMDITARKQAEAERERAEAALISSERRFRALIDNCADAVALLDQDGEVQYASPATTRILGYELDAYIGENAFAFIHPDDLPFTAGRLTGLLRHPVDRFTTEFRALHADGSWRWIEATAVNSLSDPAIAGIVVNFHDVTERKSAEAALRASEERYRAISELVSDYAFAYWLDADGTATLDWVTDAMTRITGYTAEEMRTAQAWHAVTHPEDISVALQRRQRLHAGLSDVSEYRVAAKDGRTLWLRFYSRPVWDAAEGRVVRIYGAVQDITKLKQLEQQLNQAQKMEAIGRLAGGIAHDFNNLLTVILGNAQLLLDTHTEHDIFHRDIEQIRQSAQRAAALTRQLLAFSRQQVLELRLLDLNAVVTNMGQLLRRLIGEDIDLITRLAPDLGAVKADPGQLEQVIMNLAVNARDAMPTGGTLAIETANTDVYDADVRAHIGVAGGPYIVLTISDTGMGMDAATRAHIFEPFFTTKALGKGTGLGLATVHGIVTQSGGHIWVYSEPGYGTTFKIYLPRVDTAEKPSGADIRPAQVPDGDATILLVEDEPLLRDLSARALRRYGYQVLEAEDGPGALEIAAMYAGPIDLLLTDVIMPGGIGGRQLAERVVALRPTLKVLYMSGYSDLVMPQLIHDAERVFVQKPFTPDALARKVWEALLI
jgi:two-component system cell cycle sensor histidine kinase/response regulator CckA